MYSPLYSEVTSKRKRNDSYSEKKNERMMVRHEWTLKKCKRTFCEEDTNFLTVLKKAQIDKRRHSTMN